MRPVALALAGIAFTVLATSPASAATRPDGSDAWPTVGTAHFVVHEAAGVTPDEGQQVADDFEAAYAVEVTQWGFSPPLADGSLGGDGRTDVYVEPTKNAADAGEAVHDDADSPTTSGFAIISPASAGAGHVAAHELFHLIQYATYAHGASFLVEGTAEWAASDVTRSTDWLYHYWATPDEPLDCAPGSSCAASNYAYARWVFFEFLSERYGPGIVKEILRRAGAIGAGTSAALDLQAIDNVLAAHGSSLSQAFADFTVANASAAYSFPGLAGSTSHLSAAGTYTGATSIAFAPSVRTLDHLSAGFLTLYNGNPQSPAPNCGAATLRLTVTLPAGVASQAAFVDASGAHPLAVSGSTASAALPWTNCAGTKGTLTLANSSATQDGAQFVVRASVDVAPALLPAGTRAPRISLRVGHIGRVARRGRYLSFAVHASDRGVLAALLKPGYVRKNFKLKHGANRLRLRLPAGLRAGSHQLVLTVYSTTGTRGATIKRRLRIRL
jgi:hypothetical protein